MVAYSLRTDRTTSTSRRGSSTPRPLRRPLGHGQDHRRRHRPRGRLQPGHRLPGFPGGKDAMHRRRRPARGLPGSSTEVGARWRPRDDLEDRCSSPASPRRPASVARSRRRSSSCSPTSPRSCCRTSRSTASMACYRGRRGFATPHLAPLRRRSSGLGHGRVGRSRVVLSYTLNRPHGLRPRATRPTPGRLVRICFLHCPSSLATRS